MKDIVKELFSSEKSDSFHKEIIDTFFKKSIRGAPQKKKLKRKKRYFLFAAITLLSTLVLSVNIIILYKKYLPNKTDANLSSVRYLEDIIKNGQFNRTAIAAAYFDGDAVGESVFLKNRIKLVNSGEYGRASLTVVFGKPVNLDSKSLLISAKTEHGTKKINLILKDTQNRFYGFTEMPFSSNWNLKHIYLDKRYNFDFKRIKELKIEFGSFTAGNKQKSTLYIKDLIVRRSL